MLGEIRAGAQAAKGMRSSKGQDLAFLWTLVGASPLGSAGCAPGSGGVEGTTRAFFIGEGAVPFSSLLALSMHPDPTEKAAERGFAHQAILICSVQIPGRFLDQRPLFPLHSRCDQCQPSLSSG